MARRLAYSGIVRDIKTGETVYTLDYFEGDSRALAIDHLMYCAWVETHRDQRNMQAILTPKAVEKC